MTVTAVTSAGSAAPASTARSLGQADFIRLLTTQMKSQDPTDPVDNKEMIAQMAQFSSLAGIDQMNRTLQAISAQLAQVIATQSAQPPAQET